MSRNAERSRTSTCSFADRITRLSIDEYRLRTQKSCETTHHQTCIASFIAHDVETDSLSLLSFGSGTKFVSGHQTSPSILRDSHAEIVAKRGLRRYFLNLVSEHLLSSSCDTKSSILVRHAGDKFSLKDGVTIHMYCSSSPCGNSTIRRWAKNKQLKFDAGLKLWPSTDSHTMINGSGIREGQFALLLKGGDGVFGSENESVGSNICHPVGTSPVLPGSEYSAPHTCSDKIFFWNTLGVQGAFLSHFFVKKILITSIVVGRKFAFEHCRRALCCRAGKGKKRESEERHHVSLMTSEIKFDSGEILNHGGDNEEEVGAIFTSNSFAYWGEHVETIDGASGLLDGGKSSELSSLSFARHFSSLVGVPAEGIDSNSDIAALKSRFGSDYIQEKYRLKTQGDEFRNWVSKND